MTIRLRSYQIEAVEAILSDLSAGVKRPACVIPTGGGKTVVFSALTDRWREQHGGKVLILAHRDELITQARDKYLSVNPGSAVGVVKASQDETDAPVVIGSVQTLARTARRDRLDDVSLLICDEAHHGTARSYRNVFDHFSPAPVVGFTATLARGDGARLGDVWDKISYQRPLLRMIREGYLVDVSGIRVKVPDLDLSNLHKTAGDYREGELGERLEASMAPETVAKAYREHAADMPGIIFAPTVATAQVFAEAMRDEGFTCEAVWGAMPIDDRRAVLRDYEAGKIQVLSNCMVLTEGFDSPRAQCVVIARPTASATLYIQMVGRVLRLFPGKGKALVLDVVGASGQHELMTLATLGGDTPIQPKQGQSLLQALDELEAQGDHDDDTDEGYKGDVVAEVVDLFAGSRQSWLQTEGGNWFIPAGERFIVLLPTPTGHYDIAWLYAKRRGGEWVTRDVPDLGYAMAQGEGVITFEEEVLSARDRAWRKRRMTEKQMNFARQLGIPVDSLDPSTRAGALGDMISVKLATRRIDRSLRRRPA